jgi:hypothetical protein
MFTDRMSQLQEVKPTELTISRWIYTSWLCITEENIHNTWRHICNRLHGEIENRPALQEALVDDVGDHVDDAAVVMEAADGEELEVAIPDFSEMDVEDMIGSEENEEI